MRIHSGARYAANPEYYRAYSRRWRTANAAPLKLEAFNHYGGPVCVDCGETDVAKLSLDHINDDGNVHRQALGMNARGGGYNFYAKLKRLGWPNDPPLQVLCRSCNTRKACYARIA